MLENFRVILQMFERVLKKFSGRSHNRLIRIDNHSLFYCTLHPDVQSYHLESIEHHMKYKDPEVHKSEILKQLIAYVSKDELES
jgi:hypothetical protein